ncbi:hypothetical protein QZH41_002777 [Actinostola sp. cb2023]|nr:hypothetical protein QZH41_002777 [Actinostola sp. cb2023]
MQTAPKPEVLKRKVKKSGIPVNIALIMFDSTSAANFIRKMPKTNDYLKTRPTVFMKGNTIVGDGTTAQLCAMLTGVPEEEQPEARRSKPNAKVVDDWKWVFRDYQKHGYVTMYSEDSPGLGTFNYRLKGFKNPPTDHYGSYTERLKIAFLLFSDLTHGNMNSIKFADADLLELLQTMDRDNYLDDTIVFIFGDHGLRFGAMRKTFQGKLEERLPHMSITFPTWFPKRYPQLYEAVQQNSKLLTTPFDIYGTIQHVLSYPLAPKGVTIGQSLFIPIDAQNRTCASTGVEDHWCPCMNFENVPIQDPVVKKIANFTVAFINNLLKNDSKVEPLCHKLSLKEVKTALREMPNDKVQKFKTSYRDHRCDSCGVSLGDKDENTLTHDTLYQIQFVTSPNDGFYEASVRVHGAIDTAILRCVPYKIESYIARQSSHGRNFALPPSTISPSIYYRALSGLIGPYRALSGLIGPYRALSGLYRATSGHFGPYRAISGLNRAISGLIGPFHLALIGTYTRTTSRTTRTN